QAEAAALTRVQLAATAGRENIRQGTEDLLTAARVLAERPTLQRLLRGNDAEQLRSFLGRYCEGAALDGCAVLRGELLAASGDERIVWPQAIASATEQGERFLVAGAIAGVPVAGGRTVAVEHPDVTVLALRRMDEAFAARLSERAGTDVRILDY